MYYLEIATKYNVIRLEIDDLDSPELKEILEQPWVESYEYIKLESKNLEGKYRRLKKCTRQ